MEISVLLALKINLNNIDCNQKLLTTEVILILSKILGSKNNNIKDLLETL